LVLLWHTHIYKALAGGKLYSKPGWVAEKYSRGEKNFSKVWTTRSFILKSSLLLRAVKEDGYHVEERKHEPGSCNLI